MCILASTFFTEVLASNYTIDRLKDVGNIPFQTNTTPAGALTYTVPIECYQNPKGMQPNLSLAYNSMSGMGIAGMGWSISGLSSISRVNSTNYYDGTVRAANFSDTCAFVLDGVRLVKKEGTDYLVTEQGNILVKPYHEEGYLHFEVFFPNGSKAIYGERWIGGPLASISYPIRQMQDKDGNSIRYTYENIGYIPYVKTIYYASNTIGNSASIHFEYNYIQTGVPSYFDGQEVSQTYLLQRIQVQGPNITENIYDLNLSYKYVEEKDIYYLEKIGKKSAHTNKEINPLVFAYGSDKEEKLEVSKRTLVDYPTTLDSIVALIPIKFSAKEPTNGLIVMPEKSTYYFGQFSSGASGLKIPGHSLYYNDTAYIYKDIINTQLPPVKMPLKDTETDIFRGLFSIDYKGIGANQILIVSEKQRMWEEDQSVTLFELYNSEGEKEDSFQIELFEKFVKPKTENGQNIFVSASRTYFIGDFTGSGYENLLYITHGEDFNGDARASTAVLVDFKQKKILYNKECFTVNPGDIISAVDWDGDGITDIYHMTNTRTTVYKFDIKLGLQRVCSDSYLMSAPLLNGTTHERNGTVLFGDINGDGKTDILKSPPHNKGAYTGWRTFYSTGKSNNTNLGDISGGFGGYFTDPDDICTFNPDYKYFLQDVDGNGLPDLVVLDPEGTVSVHKNIKGKFTKEPVIAPEKVDKRSKLVISRVREANKLYPVMGVKGQNLSFISNSVNQQEKQLMSSSFSSYGVETKHSYGTLTNKEICTVEEKEPLSFPYNYLVEDIFVLKNTQTFLNGLKTSNTSYHYKNPVVHRQGLGFRGFEQVIITDSLREQTTKQTFDPKMFSVLTNLQTPTMSVKSKYDTHFLENKRVQVLLKNEVQNDLLNGTTKTSVFEYDTYGNLTGQSVDYGEKIKSVRSNTLENINTDNLYLLGLVKEEKQTDTRNGVSSVTKTNIEYNSLYLPESKKSYYNDNFVSEEKYKYDSSNNIEQVQTKTYTSQNWLTTSYEYDGLGRKIKETDPLGLFTEYIYGDKNQLQSVKNHKGHETKYAYDTWGRNTSTIYPDGTVESTSLAWTDSPTGALIVSTTTATGQPDTQTYLDALGREIRKGQKRFDGIYLYTDNEYDELGRIKKSSLPFRGTNPTLWNTYEYDSYDRLKVLNYASGKKDTYAYGKLQTRSDIDGVASIKTFDVSGQVISVEDAAGTITYKYRPDGQPSSIVAPGDIETSFEYDTYGRQTAINDPSAGTKTFAYDAAGNTNQETDARGKITKMSYDSYNRLKKKEVVGEISTDYIFNTDGLLESETSSNSTSKTYVYDELLRLKTQKETVVDGKWLQKAYTYAAGNLSATAYTSQSGDIVTENYTYTNGHNTEIKLNNTTSVWKLTGENNMGMPASSATGLLSRTYGYDNFGLPTSRVIKNGTTVIQDFSYQIDPQTGNLTLRKDNTRGLQEDFTYDKINRLTGFGNKKMSYDVKGNITYFPNVGQFKYSASKPYALTAIASCEQGDLGGLENYRRGQTVTYTNMMRPQSISENNRMTTFTYNGNGDRVKILTQRGDTTELERYYISEQYEIDKFVGGTEERLYLGGDAYSAAAVYVRQGTGAWQIQYIGRDYLGSITHVIDATGTVKQELSYDPWGRLRNPVTQTLYDIDNRLKLVLGDRGYTGHEHLTTYGLINMNARLYDPVVGRFLSPDPYVQAPDFSQNFNRYSYALNNPLRYTDPNGEFVFVPFLIAAVVGGGINWWAHGASFDMAGLAYFGIGAGVGIAGMVTGGAAFTALAGAGAAVGTGGALVGVGAGAIGFFGASTVSMLGNNVLMGDPMPTGGELAMGMGISMATGGLMNGTMAAVNGNNFWNGAPRAFGRSAFAFNNTPRVPAPAKIEAKPFTLQNVQKSSVDINKTKMQNVRNLGVDGENAVGISGSKPRIDSYSGTASYRIPDRLTMPNPEMPVGVLEEVKNVAYLRYTNQIKDFVQFSQENNLKLIIYTRSTTVIAPPLRPLIENQTIIRLNIPK